MLPHAVIEFAELGSTNDHARAHLRELAHGDVIHARIQTAGRGRWERKWVSHLPGNLCLTLVLKPEGRPIEEMPLACLSQLLAVSTCRVLETYDLQPTLKWPNDIQVDGQKIAGILAEAGFEGAIVGGVLLGIGVNLNLDAATLSRIDQPATSLTLQLGRPVDVSSFRDALLSAFFERYDAFMSRGFALIREEYLSRCRFIGKRVGIRWPAGETTGVARTVNEEGAIELLDGSGQIQVVTLGEIFAS